MMTKEEMEEFSKYLSEKYLSKKILSHTKVKSHPNKEHAKQGDKSVLVYIFMSKENNQTIVKVGLTKNLIKKIIYLKYLFTSSLYKVYVSNFYEEDRAREIENELKYKLQEHRLKRNLIHNKVLFHETFNGDQSFISKLKSALVSLGVPIFEILLPIRIEPIRCDKIEWQGFFIEERSYKNLSTISWEDRALCRNCFLYVIQSIFDDIYYDRLSDEQSINTGSMLERQYEANDATPVDGWENDFVKRYQGLFKTRTKVNKSEF